jgi:hypothetical protein
VKRGPALAAVLSAAALVRLPFWAEALRTPVDGDTAIVGLMARHPLASAALWGQPYGSPLDAWLALPFLAAFGWGAIALRAAYFVLGLALVALAYLVAWELEPRAALPAGLLMACPSAYMILLACLPPPLYPTTLVLCGLLLLSTLRVARQLDTGGRPRAGLVVLGGLGGLAVWTHLMSAAVVLPCAVYLATRVRGRRRLLGFALVPLLVASFPWWRGFVRDPAWVTRVVALSSRDETTGAHFREVAPALPRTVAGLLGTHTPVIADDPDHAVAAPAALAAGLVVLYAGALVAAVVRSRFRGAAGLLLGCVTLVVASFPFPLRSGPHTIRYLSAAYLPVVVLVAWAATGDGWRRRGRVWILVLAFAASNLVGASRLLAAWRTTDRTAAPFSLADLGPVRDALEARHVTRAYAAYDTAYRLTFETRERLIVSEPWNERFRHYPLPYLDEVRFAKNVAWVLAPPGGTGDLPAPQRFEESLGGIGGRWSRTRAGRFWVYDAFVPPFGPTVDSPPGAGPAGDRDLGTSLTPDPRAPLVVDLGQPRCLDAVTLVASPDGPRLLRSMDVEVSADGLTFETVSRRRRREERHDLRWLNGQPQYVLDHDVIAIPLDGRRVAAIRIIPYASTETWTLAEILLHPTESPAARGPWDEWLDPGLSWPQRRAALARHPRPDREDWYFRTLLAARHR